MRIARSSALSAAALSMALWSPAALAQVELDPTVTQWSNNVWESAKRGDFESLQKFLTQLPDDTDGAGAARFRDTVSLYAQTREQAEKKRVELLTEARTEMDTAIKADELSKALAAAINVQALDENLELALANPEVLTLVDKAKQQVAVAESGNDWLHAQELLFRLRTLYEDTSQTNQYQEYDAQLKKVNRRVAMLAQYAPRRLFELRNKLAIRLGQEPDKEFNEALANDWREHIEGIEPSVLKAALQLAARNHIENDGWLPLLTGGLEAMHLLATTTDLAETFPGLSDPAQVAAFDAFVQKQLRLVDASRGKVPGLSQLLDELAELNDTTIKLPTSLIYREFGDGATYKLAEVAHDDYTEIIWPEKLRRFKQATEGKFVGVGILIRHNEKREIVVVTPLEGEPAYFAGVKPEDKIVEVNGESTVGWTLNDAVDRITGPKGTAVELGLRRGESPDIVRLKVERDVVEIRSVRGWWKTGLDAKGEPTWNWYIDPVSRIAYIRLTEFSEDSPQDLQNAWQLINRDGPPGGVILDLRHNPGGLLDAAVRISNLFVTDGLIVSGEDRNGDSPWHHDARANQADIAKSSVPVVVLINKGSASASEIVAGCLQAHNAAIVVGERSFGKGSVQTVHTIGPNALVKLTTQYYRLPPKPGDDRGRLVHKRPGATEWGVDPDIEVKMTLQQVEAAYTMRQAADIIPEDAEGKLAPESPDRPDINKLLTEGHDPQLQTALLLLQARVLGTMGDARHASIQSPAGG
jgi:carboxyl-terminal processing protease